MYIFIVKFFKCLTKRGMPIYMNIPCLKVHQLSNLRDLEVAAKLAYCEAVRLLRAKGVAATKQLEFFVIKPSPHKGGDFVKVFPKLRVDDGRLLSVGAPPRRSPEHRIYEEWLLKMYLETRDVRWWFRYLGIQREHDKRVELKPKKRRRSWWDMSPEELFGGSFYSRL